jgi:4-amino-4-deoxy-L-arabinose transferase-like glycosyltransferase
MRSPSIFKDVQSTARQAIAAWIILPISVVVFATLGTALSLLIPDRQTVVIIAFLLVLPLLVAAHIWLYQRDYYLLRKPIKPVQMQQTIPVDPERAMPRPPPGSPTFGLSGTFSGPVQVGSNNAQNSTTMHSGPGAPPPAPADPAAPPLPNPRPPTPNP